MRSLLVTAAFMFALDCVWLYLNSKAHSNLIQNIQGSAPTLRLIPAVLIYILIPLGVYVFAISNSNTLKSAALKGAFLGLCMYGVYDLTNYATLKNYTLTMTLTDMAWGTFLCAAGAAVGYTFRR